MGIQVCSKDHINFQKEKITKWIENSYVNEIYKSSPAELLGQFQPHLVQSILKWWEFIFIPMKDHTFFQAEIITKLQKFIYEIKIPFSRNTWPFKTIVDTKHLWIKGNSRLFKQRAIPLCKGK